MIDTNGSTTTITPLEAKRRMAEAIWRTVTRLDDTRLSSQSFARLNCFATVSMRHSLRLILATRGERERESESRRSVRILLARRQDGTFRWFVRLECSTFSSTDAGTREALRSWRAAHEIARVALECADSMPTIKAEALQPVDNLIGVQ